ncbi:unnamed protein product [Closterium sp. NIES-53]
MLRIYYDTGSVDLLVRKVHLASWDGLVYAASAEPEGLPNSTFTSTSSVSGEALHAANNSQARRSGHIVLLDGYPHANTSTDESPVKQYYLCVCTMVLDSAKFMEEWLLYHGFLGVEHFFVYDNGSEDGLQESVEEAQETGRARGFGFSTTIRSWPWLKSQEGGFSHCAIRAKKLCTWVIFVDVDEFVFPAWKLKKIESRKLFAAGSQYSSLLRKFVGQIALPCLIFGPSGHQEHPERGVVSGYTCRLELPDRHKSVILTESLDPPYHNVIHHFTSLKHQYCTLNVGHTHGAIFHYKYQAWPEFKTKFRRRASTFVADWTQMDRLQSKDRVPDLGVEAREPADWKDRYCEIEDYRLKRTFTQMVSATSYWRYENAFAAMHHIFENLFGASGLI